MFMADILGNIIMRDEEDDRKITEVVCRAKEGINKYLIIMNQFLEVDVSKDDKFQRRFNHFYKIRQKPKDWYKTYYQYMEAMKGEEVSFSRVLNYFHAELDRYEASFSSKFVATHNPEMPIWDRFVLENIGLKAPAYNAKNRLHKIEATYQKIIEWYSIYLHTDKGKLIIKKFNELVDKSDSISDVKKIDFYLWQKRA
jgi:hypothetical protein